MNRTVYHTTIKELVHHDLLPKDQLKKIPRTNVSRWRNDNMNRFVGSELTEVALLMRFQKLKESYLLKKLQNVLIFLRALSITGLQLLNLIVKTHQLNNVSKLFHNKLLSKRLT